MANISGKEILDASGVRESDVRDSGTYDWDAVKGVRSVLLRVAVATLIKKRE